MSVISFGRLDMGAGANFRAGRICDPRRLCGFERAAFTFILTQKVDLRQKKLAKMALPLTISNAGMAKKLLPERSCR